MYQVATRCFFLSFEGWKLKLKHTEITGKIIGAAFAVHTELGPGFKEVIYQRALAYEFRQFGLDFIREYEMDIFYKDIPRKLGGRRVDFFVENKVMVEIKARKALEDAHLVQTLNYMRISNIEIGLLLNFGERSLRKKRLILKPKINLESR